MDDKGLLNKPQDDKTTDDDQKKIDEALNQLPDTSQPTTPPEPAKVTPPPPSRTPLPPPSIPSTPPVTSPPTDDKPIPTEEVKIKKPKRRLGKNAKKIVGGMLVMALLVGGTILGRGLIQKETRVEPKAYSDCYQQADCGELGCPGNSVRVCCYDDNSCANPDLACCHCESRNFCDGDPNVNCSACKYYSCDELTPVREVNNTCVNDPPKSGFCCNGYPHQTDPCNKSDFCLGKPTGDECGQDSGIKCAEKNVGDACDANNANSRCIWLQNQGDACSCGDTCNTNSGVCSQQSIGSECNVGGTCVETGVDDRYWANCACQGSACGSGCGNEPSYSFNAPPKTVGPFPEDGTVVVYYASGFNPDDFEQPTSVGRKINLEHGGQSYTLDTTTVRERIVTDIKVSAGETINLVSIEEQDQGSPACAPVQGAPFYAWGWIDPNSDNTCGSGLVGPPSQCPLFGKVDITDHITWGEGYGKEIVSKQCWGDWREWVGDYDFNDFFLMFSYMTDAEPDLSCVDLSSDTDPIEYGDTVNFTCEGAFSSVTAPVAYFRYSVDGGTYTTSAAVAVDLVSNAASYDIDVNEYGEWSVECRVCEDDTAASCTAWGEAN